MPYVRIWVHLIWSTKNREPYLLGEIGSRVKNHIIENADKKDIHLDCINGSTDHLHALISLKADQSISKVAQLLKGESSHWVNEQNLSRLKFEWQDEYFALSVAESEIGAVREYIRNQEEHHRKKSYSEEYTEFMKKYGFDILQKATKV